MTKEISEKNNENPVVKAFARNLRISPRKIRLVTNLVKNMHVADAIVELQHSTKKAAPMVLKLVQSAIANAKNNFNLDADKLYIKTITADMGAAMKRYFPRARGSAFVIRRKLSHVNLFLESRGGKAGKSSAKLLALKKVAEKQKVKNADHEEAVSKKEVKEPKHSHFVKTEEQIKMNKAQNKRRLFNRKSGE